MKKYVSPITKTLTPENWKDAINLPALSLDDLTDLLADLKAMEAFGKKVGGFIKEAVKGRIPKGEMEYTSKHFYIQLSNRVRAGGLDKVRILEDMGEEWVEDHSKPNTKYVELRLTALETES